MTYGSSPYGSSEYAGGTISSSPVIQKSLKYTIISPYSLTKSLKYTIISPLSITKSLQYDIGIPTSITKSLKYAVASPQLITKSLRYAVHPTQAPISLQLQYVVQVPVTDDDDYSKQIIVSEYTTTSIVLWENQAALANEVTNDLDISKMGAMGIYIQVDQATTINFQVETITSLDGSGWSVYDSHDFAAAGAEFYNIWILPFQKIRFQTTSPATITVQCWIRT